jgi:hypothetical protein
VRRGEKKFGEVVGGLLNQETEKLRLIWFQGLASMSRLPS